MRRFSRADGLIYIADSFGFPKIDKPEAQAAQRLLAQVVMDKDVQIEFSLKKGSIPVRTDVDTSKLDVCAKKGVELLKEGKVVPDHVLVLTPNNVGTLGDLIGEFWSDAKMKNEDMVERFIEVLKAG